MFCVGDISEEGSVLMLDRIKGALFGLAIGDALGGTTEFLSKEEVKEKYGRLTEIVGGGVWKLEKGETTDDTAMTLAVAKGIIKNPDDPISAIGEYFLEWYQSNPKDIGNIIRTVFELYDGDWFAAAKLAHEKYLGGLSAGNGTLMRCLPVALSYKSLTKVEEITERQSEMTHYDNKAAEACLIYNRIAYKVLNGGDLSEAIAQEVKGTIYETVLEGKKPTCLPDGYVVHTMQWVLYWLMSSETFLDVVVGAANEGEDSDTVGAIAGGLAGLAFGYEGIPKEYREALLEKDTLVEISNQLQFASL